MNSLECLRWWHPGSRRFSVPRSSSCDAYVISVLGITQSQTGFVVYHAYLS